MSQAPIRVIVSGGLVQDVLDIPVGMLVQVIDYDVEGVDIDSLNKDADGEDCIICTYQN
jgi:hypothetical protein